MVDFNLRADEEALVARARRVAREVVQPFAKRSDAERVFDKEVIRGVGKEGLLGGPIKKEWGGLGLSYVAQALVYEELGAVDSSVRGFMAVQTGLVASCIQEWGNDEQRRRWLPGLCDASLFGCYALTEEEAGSDPAAMATVAVKDGDDWIIDGKKIWITNGNVADVAIVFAQADPSAEPRHRGITAFLVPTATAGLEREKMTAPELGHRGADHARLVFKSMRVPDAARLGAFGKGFRVAMSALDHGRIGVAAGAVGVHRACLEASVAFARSRRQFGKPIGDFQMVQKTIADMHVGLEAARLLTLKAAWLKDKGLPSTTATSVAKLYASEAAAKAAHDAVLLHGGRGYNNDYPVERYYRDIVGLEIYEGTSNVQRMIVAGSLLKDGEGKKNA